MSFRVFRNHLQRSSNPMPENGKEPPAFLTRIRIVLADDHVITRLGVLQLLQPFDDIEVAGQASTGREALGLVEELQPDVLVMEAALPDLSGAEIMEALAALEATPHVLILSAYAEDRYIRCLLDHGIRGYLTKRVDPEMLVAGIRAVARGQEGWLSPAVVQKALNLKKREELLESLQLTEREKTVLALLLQGHENVDIAETLFVCRGTVKNYLTSIYGKLGVRSRVEAVLWAYQHELIGTLRSRHTREPAPAGTVKSRKGRRTAGKGQVGRRVTGVI